MEVIVRKEFELFPEDKEHLDRLGLTWESIIDGSNSWVIIRKQPIIEGYNMHEVDVAVMMPVGYRQTPLDMVYFYPALSRLDGIAIPASDSLHQIEGKTYQRWSRHRNGVTWRPEIDSLGTHLLEIEHWLENEFVKRPRQDEPA